MFKRVYVGVSNLVFEKITSSNQYQTTLKSIITS